MGRRLSRLKLPVTVALAAAVTVSGCAAPVHGRAPAGWGPRLTVVPPDRAADIPDTVQSSAAFDGLQDRADQAISAAAESGADITFLLLDRGTGRTVSHQSNTPIEIASVAKLFIADDLLLQEAKGQTVITSEDRAALDDMLRKSDDNPAEDFWNRSDGDAIITRVAARYGLFSTKPPTNGHWWNTTSTTGDLVHYYDMLMSGRGGLPPEQANIVLSNLAQSAPEARDTTQPGEVYPQRFGIPDGLFADPVVVKQGWMCIIGSDWMHLSTGVIGPDRRYVMAISSLQTTDPATARDSVTDAVRAMFPTGHI